MIRTVLSCKTGGTRARFLQEFTPFCKKVAISLVSLPGYMILTTTWTATKLSLSQLRMGCHRLRAASIQ